MSFGKRSFREHIFYQDNCPKTIEKEFPYHEFIPPPSKVRRQEVSAQSNAIDRVVTPSSCYVSKAAQKKEVDNNDKNGEEKKPKRPLSAYNIFFRDHRKLILSSSEHSKEIKTRDNTEVVPEEKKSICADSQSLDLQPKKRRGRPRGPNFSKKTAPHHKISFEQMAKVISRKWQEMKDNDSVKEKYNSMAENERKRYQEEMAAYKKRRDKKHKKTESQSNEIDFFRDEKPLRSQNFQNRKHRPSTNRGNGVTRRTPFLEIPDYEKCDRMTEISLASDLSVPYPYSRGSFHFASSYSVDDEQNIPFNYDNFATDMNPVPIQVPAHRYDDQSRGYHDFIL